jgi:hypothetical protein
VTRLPFLDDCACIYRPAASDRTALHAGDDQILNTGPLRGLGHGRTVGATSDEGDFGTHLQVRGQAWRIITQT